jgi:hypothetical protein
MNVQVQEIVRRSAGLVELIDKELAREER